MTEAEETQLLELQIPVVVALNKSDINEKRETLIDEKLLSQKLGCPVIKTVSTSADGLKTLIEAAALQAGKEQIPVPADTRMYRGEPGSSFFPSP